MRLSLIKNWRHLNSRLMLWLPFGRKCSANHTAPVRVIMQTCTVTLMAISKRRMAMRFFSTLIHFGMHQLNGGAMLCKRKNPEQPLFGCAWKTGNASALYSASTALFSQTKPSFGVFVLLTTPKKLGAAYGQRLPIPP